MGKRQRLSEDGNAAVDVISENTPENPSKRPRKETNASARRTLFVRSLPAIATSQALTELFSQSYPLKHATVVIDTETKQSKGYGFVTFADAEDAQRAQDEFNGKTFLGRRMKIEIAQPRSRDVVAQEGTDGKKRSTVSADAAAIKKARQEKMAEERKPPKMIIRNLPWSIDTSEKLEELFRKFGKVKHATLPKVNNKQAGFGFVVMRGRKNAEKALAAINGMTVDGRPIAVDWAVEKDVYEGQKKTADAEDQASGEVEMKASRDDEQAGSENEEDDVANFMRNFGDQLQSESESEDEDEDDDMQKMDDNEDNNDDLGFENSEEYESVDGDDNEDESENSGFEVKKPEKTFITDNSSTVFVRNLPFTTLDADLKEHFAQFGPVRYARVVMDRATDRPKGTGFVCFFNVEDANSCFRSAPRHQPTGANATKKGDSTASKVKHSVLEDENADISGMYTLEGRVLQIARAVDRDSATKLTEEATDYRTDRDKDKRKLYLLSEGTVASGTPLYEMLAPSEIKMREDSAKQRKKLIQNNPTLHLSLTRLSIRNLPRNINSKDLKALAREAVVGFAKDVKAGLRTQLSKEEEARGGEEMRQAEKLRKEKGKGIVRQAKIVFEGREGAKVSEDSGAGRSRGYGFVEYSGHRWALMGLRWLNGHAVENSSGKKQRLIVEFAIENAQVVQRRKEREEKARVRSKEVLAARERGEVVLVKKAMSKNTVMAKTRKGMKGKKGRPGPSEKSFDRVVTNGTKGKKDDEKPKALKKPNKVPNRAESKSKPTVAAAEDGKLAKRAQIIQKKRMMRRNRRQGKA